MNSFEKIGKNSNKKMNKIINLWKNNFEKYRSHLKFTKIHIQKRKNNKKTEQ